MESKVATLVLTALLMPALARSQSIVRTILGGSPDGGQALAATLKEPSAVVSDKNGNVYVALKGAFQVVEISPGGTATVVVGTGIQGSTGDGGPALEATLSTPVALAVDSAGNLYIADSGANNVRRVGTDRVINTIAGNGYSGYAGDGGPANEGSLNSPSALAFDSSGDLLIADSGNNVIRMVTPNGTITTVAGNGSAGSNGDNGPALQAYLDYPQGVAADSAGNVYISDSGNDWIRIVSPTGTISRFAGANTSGAFGGGADPSIALNATLRNPTGLVLDKAGNVYFIQAGADQISRITTDGKIANFAGTGSGSGASGDGGLARFANISVQGIAFNPQGNLLIADGANNRVRIVNTTNNIINTLAGTGLASYNPQGFALQGDVLYFSDTSANRVRKFNLTTGETGVVAGDGEATFAGDGGAAVSASLDAPIGLALDGSGNLYIADSGNERIRRVTPDGIISTIVGTGTASSTGDGSAATNATIDGPSGVAVDSSGNLFIAERAGQRIREVNSGGTISTIAGTGTGGAPSAETGNALDEELYYPEGLTVEPDGSLLIADSGNDRIRRWTKDGTITTVAGSFASGSSGDGGPATSAALASPSDVTIDSYGNLYIADTENQEIRRVTTDGIINTVAGNTTAGYNGDGSPATAIELNGPAAVIPGPGCSVLIADTQNQILRQLWPAVNYTITSAPAGLQITVDGQISVAPLVVSLLPGTQHQIGAPGTQAGTLGTQYLASGTQTISVPCGIASAAVAVNFSTQYSLTITADDGGSVSPAAQWQDAGASVVLTATPATGFVFAGWEGNCSGTGACQLSMNGPKNVKADFAPANVQQGIISAGGVVGGGLSTPPVKALSSNAIAVVLGQGFAPAGITATAGPGNLINGNVSTELIGVCVLVGGTAAPVLAVTPTQINFQVPHIPVSGTVTVQVVTGCGTANQVSSAAVTVPAQSATPEFFYYVQNASGQNPIAAINTSTGVDVGSPGLLPGATFAPAKPGDVITLYATGLGLTSPRFAPGEFPPKASPIIGKISVSVGSTKLDQADILYAGVALSQVGLYEINIRLPDSIPNGNLPVTVSVNGFASPAGGYITVQQ
jgi:uncharacterized protein (TIGR03437 family)